MEVSKQKLIQFMGNNTTMVIPVYQRNYAWEKSQCERLFNDIVNIEEQTQSYFLGASVVVKEPKDELLLIDGQQRMTSISLFLLAICNLLKDKKIRSDMNNLHKLIWDQCLVNPFEEENLYIRLKQVNQDERAYKNLFYRAGTDSHSYDTDPELKKTKIYKNYIYFENSVISFCKKNEVVDKLWYAFKKLEIAHIELNINQGDKPQLVFETINARGKGLENADLIRNYILIDRTKQIQEKWFKNYWQYIEKNTYHNNESHTTEAIRYYLMYKKGLYFKKDTVYQNFKSSIDDMSDSGDLDQNIEKIESFLKEVREFSKYYKWIADICDNQKFEEYFIKFRKLGQATPTPYFMGLMNLYEQEQINEDEVCNVLNFILNYYIRRAVIALGTTPYNRLYAGLTKNVEKMRKYYPDYVVALYATFSNLDYSDKYPDNEEIKQELPNKQFFRLNNYLKRTVLESICNYDTKEKIKVDDNIEIEHIMPQSFRGYEKQWQEELGSSWKDIHEKYLHTIGNLTLTGYNREHTNKPFNDKKELMREKSNIRINKYFDNVAIWNEASIKDNSVRMVNRFIKAYPDIANRMEYKIDKENEYLTVYEFNPTKKSVELYKFKGDIYPCKKWVELLVGVCEKLYDIDSDKFENYVNNSSVFSSDKEQLKEAKEIVSGFYVTKAVNSQNIIRILTGILEFYELEYDFSVKLRD